MQQKNKSKATGKVTSWTQQVGVSMIGVLTALGTGLIMYTGVKAATYEHPESKNEFIVYDEVKEDMSVNDEAAANPKATVENETPVAPDQGEETNDSIAYCNIDGVNVRSEAATGTDIIGNLSEGDEVTVLNRYYSDEWVQISFEGQIGYVYTEYLNF